MSIIGTIVMGPCTSIHPMLTGEHPFDFRQWENPVYLTDSLLSILFTHPNCEQDKLSSVTRLGNCLVLGWLCGCFRECPSRATLAVWLPQQSIAGCMVASTERRWLCGCLSRATLLCLTLAVWLLQPSDAVCGCLCHSSISLLVLF